jgi:hypothetical protein
MSCILYNKDSYDALARCGTVEIFRREVVASYYRTPRALTDALFELNLKAYCDRYNADMETERGNYSDQGNRWIDETFEDLIAAEKHPSQSAALRWAEAFRLLSRIEYQCSDADDYQTNDVARHLGWFMNWAARRMADHIVLTVTKSERTSDTSETSEREPSEV